MQDANDAAVTILIADDHPLMRQGIRMSLVGESGLAVIGEAADGEEALQCITFLRPDIVILDLDMPKRDGLAVMREINRLGIVTGVIILTLHSGADLVAEAVELGIRGYIIKTSAAMEVAEAVRRVAGGGSYLSEAARKAMQPGKAVPELSPELQALTPLELLLVRKIAQGQTSREIAHALELSGRTIENYRTTICTKLGLAGPNALLRYALSQKSLSVS